MQTNIAIIMMENTLTTDFLYVKNNRALTKEANPELTFGEIGRKMSEDWKNNLSAEDKKRYEDEAKAEQEAYAAAMIKYKKSHKYKRYLRDLEEWNELYKEEWKLQEYEKQMEKENKKKEGKDKKKKDQKKASKRSKK